MRLALLISGGGTTMEAIIKASQDGRLPKIEPRLIISSNQEAGGIEKAKKLGIKSEDILVIHPKNFASREEFGEAIIRECEKRKIDFIGQYGWHILTPGNVIEKFRGNIINQHPGPLDIGKLDFGGAGMFGMRVHQTRLEFVRKVNRDFWTEATTHYVTEDFDKGKIIKRKQIPILLEDTAETLQKRVLLIEHEVQIEALKDFSEGKVIEFKREVPLVFPGEEKTLKECKEMAIKMYPKG